MSVFLFCAAMELCACHMHMCILMSTDITTTEATFPKGNEEETENLTLGRQKVPTLLNSEKKPTAQGAKAVYIIILINLFLYVSLVLL